MPRLFPHPGPFGKRGRASRHPGHGGCGCGEQERDDGEYFLQKIAKIAEGGLEEGLNRSQQRSKVTSLCDLRDLLLNVFIELHSLDPGGRREGCSAAFARFC
ncbi:MAG: hypothetical protein U1F87_09750 [Kiritimatiellia bacterium]